MKNFRLLGFSCLLMASAAVAADFDTTASYAYLVDYDTGAVLLDKGGDELMAPASMSKLMTAYIVFDKLQKGQLSLTDEFEVSENAWRKGGEKSGSSTMFLKPHSKVKLDDLLKGIIVQSGNDACITVAENIAGSEENFAAEMTIKARELGLPKSTFKNATGWPDKEHLMTPKELAQLTKLIIQNFPEYYPYYSIKSFKYNGINQENRNPLLYSMPDQADGVKTGHTGKSGHGLVGSAKSKDGKRRLILVVNGLKTMKDRGMEAKRIMEWGFREFDNYSLFAPGQTVERIPVWMGTQKTVPVTLKDPALVTLNRLDKLNAKVIVTADGPVKAPVHQGDKVAELNILLKDGTKYSFPLIAQENIGKIGYFGKMGLALKSLFYGTEGETDAQ